MRNRGGEASPLTEHDSSVRSFQFSPDGGHIYFTAPNAKTPEEKKKDKLADDVFAFDEDYKQQHLFRVAADGDGPQKADRITEGDYSVIGFRLSDDGMRIAHHRSLSPLVDNRDEGEVWIMDRGRRKRGAADRQHGERVRRPAFSGRRPRDVPFRFER